MNQALAAPLIREMSPGERSHAETDIHRWMGYPASANLAKSYPQIFRPEGSALSLGAFLDGELCSHTTYRRVDLHASRGCIRATLVGDVATAPERRGTRLASKILQEVATREQAEGQDCLLLWTDLWDFYARLGFAPAGVQIELQMHLRQSMDSPLVRRAGVSDVLAIADLHAQKPWRVERSLEEIALLLSVANMDCMVLEEGGEVRAYACHGKGLDLQGWWHELGGSDHQLQILIPAAMTQLGQTKATVILPNYRHHLLDGLTGCYDELSEGIVSLCKPLTENGLCDFFVDGLDSI